MKNLLLLITVIALFTVSCENAQQTKKEKAIEQEVVVDLIADIDINDFDSLAGDYVGKKIRFDGIVDHICQHGGQRMFLVSPESEARVKVTTDENMAAFPVDMEGSNVEVVGVVDELRIDEPYLKEWEEESKAENGEHNSEVGLHDGTGQDHHDESGAIEQINNLRTQLQASGKDHLSFYSVICKEYKSKDVE